MAKAPEYLIPKIAPDQSVALDYPFHDRAQQLYNQWISGFTEDEIALFHQLPLEEVKRDLMYVQTKIPVRQIIAHNNDRNRIMVQREQSESFRRLFKESLELSAAQLVANGLSPAGILKEFREATGMVQKAEPLIQVNSQQNFIGGGASGSNGVTSAEDVIRKVLDRINQNALPEPGPEVIDVEAGGSTEPLEEDQIPDDED